MSTSGGFTCTPFSPVEVKLGHGRSRHQNKLKRWETKIMAKLFRLKRQKRRDVGRIPDKNQHYGQEDMG